MSEYESGIKDRPSSFTGMILHINQITQIFSYVYMTMGETTVKHFDFAET